MKVAVIGIGAIGGVVGARLASKYDDINFIARGKTLDVIKQNGIKAIRKNDTLCAKPASATDKPKELGIVDVLIICTKGYGLKTAVKECESIIDENTVILPLLNGINISDDIKKINSKGVAADGAIYVFANIKEPAVISINADMLKIVAGIKGSEENKKLKELITMLNESGITAVYSNDIAVPLWEKYIMMCGNSCAFSYFDSPAGEIQPYSEKMKYVSGVYGELADLARKSGAEVDKNIAEKYTSTFLALPKETITSLYRDIKTGSSQTEFDSIIGKAFSISKSFKADTPCINAVYHKYRG